MKHLLLIQTILLFSAYAFSQELIVNGNMEDESSWNLYWRTDSPDAGTYTFNYLVDVPSDGEGGCLQVSSFGQTGFFIFQEVTIEPGAEYTFDAVIKNISPQELANSWVELILSSTRPDDETKGDWGSGNGDYIYAQNSWMEEPFNTMDTDDPFSSTYQFTWNGGVEEGENVDLTGSSNITIPDTVTNTSWYVCFKVGCWNNAGDDSSPFEFVVDNISLIKLGTESDLNSFNKKTSFSNVYPNPSTGNITINTEKKASYKINNLSGKIIASGNINNAKSIDLSHLNKGLYTISFTSKQQIETHKLILK